jgi:hypothetical protein
MAQRVIARESLKARLKGTAANWVDKKREKDLM